MPDLRPNLPPSAQKGYNGVMSIVSHTTAPTPVVLVPPALDQPPVRNEEPTRKRWTREEYYRLDEQGWFQNQRVELIDGEIIQLSPPSPPHSVAVELVDDVLKRIFLDGYSLRHQASVVHGNYSQPEPDLAVVRGNIRDYVNEHPKTAVLIVEVSRTSLAYDKNRKLHLYASMGVPEYWILDLNDRQLLVYREPTADASAPFGFLYAAALTLSESELVSPLEKPAATIAVSALLP
jgi:Uma2 family endonuclease